VKTELYYHLVKYYETDQMGIVHHSNYIRWFEEARIDYMKINHIMVSDMEKKGIQIPVTGVSCDYVRPARFDEQVIIETKMTAYNGVRMEFSYAVCNEITGQLLVTGNSRHCFIDASNFSPVSLKKRLPEIHNYMMQLFYHDSSRLEG